MTSPYQKEQIETLTQVYRHIRELPPSEKEKLAVACDGYLAFRSRVDGFLSRYFSEVCTRKCYKSRLSACCSYEGIVTFFADVVINALLSEDQEIETLLTVLETSEQRSKCVYLGPEGCLWRVKPIVCEMFLCDHATDTVFSEHLEYGQIWEELKRLRKGFAWPDRPVLFDDLERYFMDAGCISPLMYLHNSPGLLQVKRSARA